MTPADVTKAMEGLPKLIRDLKTKSAVGQGNAIVHIVMGEAATAIESLASELAAMTARAEAAELRGATLLAANETERQTLIRHNAAHAAQVADLTAKMEAMRNFIADFAAFKFDACYRHPVASPEDEGDDVTDAEPVWSWQEDARAALKAGGA